MGFGKALVGGIGQSNLAQSIAAGQQMAINMDEYARRKRADAVAEQKRLEQEKKDNQFRPLTDLLAPLEGDEPKRIATEFFKSSGRIVNVGGIDGVIEKDARSLFEEYTKNEAMRNAFNTGALNSLYKKKTDLEAQVNELALKKPDSKDLPILQQQLKEASEKFQSVADQMHLQEKMKLQKLSQNEVLVDPTKPAGKNVIASGQPRTDENKAPTTRTVKRGDKEVTEEWNGKQWVVVGEATSAAADPEKRDDKDQINYNRIKGSAIREAAFKTAKKFGGSGIIIGADQTITLGSNASPEAIDYFEKELNGGILRVLKKTPSLHKKYGDLHEAPPEETKPVQTFNGKGASGTWGDAAGKMNALTDQATAIAGEVDKIGQTFDDLPDPKQYTGKILEDSKTMRRYKSDGKKWVEVK